jgi:hypothetical protein
MTGRKLAVVPSEDQKPEGQWLFPQDSGIKAAESAIHALLMKKRADAGDSVGRGDGYRVPGMDS